MQGVEIHERQIGALALFDGAGEVSEVQRLCAQSRSHGKHHASGNRGRIASRSFGQEGRQAHFFEHIQIVVRGRSVGSQADVHAGFQHIPDGGKSGGQLHVAGRVVRYPCAGVLQCVDFSIVDVNAMRGKQLGFKKAKLLNPWDDRHIVGLTPFFDFLLRLGNVGQQRNIKFESKLDAGAQNLYGAGVCCMWRNRGYDQLMILPFLDEFTPRLKRILERGRIGGREFEHRLRANSSQTCLGCSFGNGMLEVIHICEASCPAADHLCAGDLRSKAD